ncbi:MAG: hypothetical protein Q9224_006923, partial [Gallowayella concinna]
PCASSHTPFSAILNPSLGRISSSSWARVALMVAIMQANAALGRRRYAATGTEVNSRR